MYPSVTSLNLYPSFYSAFYIPKIPSPETFKNPSCN